MLRRAHVAHDYDETFDWIEIHGAIFVFEQGGERLVGVTESTRPAGYRIGDQ